VQQNITRAICYGSDRKQASQKLEQIEVHEEPRFTWQREADVMGSSQNPMSQRMTQNKGDDQHQWLDQASIFACFNHPSMGKQASK
jgi:hypothetical protein